MSRVLLAVTLCLTLCPELAACGSPPQAARSPQRLGVAQGAFRPLDPDLPQQDVQVAGERGSETVTAQVLGGKLLYQNDILLGTVPAAANIPGQDKISAQSTVVASGGRWTQGVIPYVFRADVPQEVREEVRQAGAIYAAQTKLRWVPRTNELYYVEFIVDDSCYSFVGRMSRRYQPQPVSLGQGECELPGALHEMAHAAGLYHEQSRPDRDRYVKVLWNNIPSKLRSQYQVGKNSAAYGPYDYRSIMHYPAYLFGKQALQPLDSHVSDEDLGASTTLTPGDIAGLGSLYP